jgi:quercetin dioxygenase-like cupin family protein
MAELSQYRPAVRHGVIARRALVQEPPGAGHRGGHYEMQFPLHSFGRDVFLSYQRSRTTGIERYILVRPGSDHCRHRKNGMGTAHLAGVATGIEIAVLRGDLSKGGGEILLRTPPKYIVPNHSHTSDEVYVWLKGEFTYIAADGSRQKIAAPAYISLPGQTPHALECGDEQCIFYLRYSRPFDLHTHAMPASK